MILARIVGTVVSTVQHPFYAGRKQLLVGTVLPDGASRLSAGSKTRNTMATPSGRLFATPSPWVENSGFFCPSLSRNTDGRRRSDYMHLARELLQTDPQGFSFPRGMLHLEQGSVSSRVFVDRSLLGEVANDDGA